MIRAPFASVGGYRCGADVPDPAPTQSHLYKPNV